MALTDSMIVAPAAWIRASEFGHAFARMCVAAV
jgi:hypothetical protein